MRTETIRTDRLRLDPLMTNDVDQLFPLLDDPALHAFIGGDPMSHDELDRWVRLVVAGESPATDERWCNWVVRLAHDATCIGTAQATIAEDEATLAWVIGTAWQGRGYAKEAASAVATWLRSEGIDRLRANIRPDHRASNAVARSIGMAATDELADGEVVWRTA